MLLDRPHLPASSGFRPLTHTDQRGKTTTYTYDSHGNVLTITDALSNVTTMAYDSAGEITIVTAPNPSTGGATGGLVTSDTRDSDERITRITNADTADPRSRPN